MRLIYIANIRLPTEKAHGIQIMEMCAAFADQGIEVNLVIPRRNNHITEDPFDYHDIRRIFSIRKLPCIDLVHFGKIGFLLETFSFAISATFFYLFRKDAIYYTRDELVALFLRTIGKEVVWEGHTGQNNFMTRMLIRLRLPMVVITEALKKLYITLGNDPLKIMVASDGADINRFNIKITQEEARKMLKLPLDKKIVLYKGHLYEWKGAHTFARAATYLKEKGIICVFIGGTEKDIEAFKNEFGEEENIFILGNKPRRETPVYQKAADILVIPNSAKDDVSKLYTSPMKLFGYMASGVPIIASDLPSLREILNDSLVYFFRPDDATSLAEVVIKALNNYPEAKKKGDATLDLAGNYSWQKRAQNILNFIKVQL